jgi:hypothetical protein
VTTNTQFIPITARTVQRLENIAIPSLFKFSRPQKPLSFLGIKLIKQYLSVEKKDVKKTPTP